VNSNIDFKINNKMGYLYLNTTLCDETIVAEF